MNSKLKAVLSVAVVIAIAGAYMFPKFVPSFGAFVGPDVFGPVMLNDGVSEYNYFATSTTATSYTLTANDIAPKGQLRGVISMTSNTLDLTLTLPASSTLAHVLPRAGMSAKQCWYNASTTAGIDLTFAAGTGIDLEVASTSPAAQAGAVLTVLADSSACMEFIRKPATTVAFDFLVLLTRYTNGD